MSQHDNLPPARVRTRKPPADSVDLPAADVAAPPGYDVGYGKPPKHARFQPGQSGNPKGRPKGSKNVNKMILDVLDERVEVSTPTGRRKVARIELVLRKLIEQAGKGDVRASHAIMRQYSAAQSALAPQAGPEITGYEEASAADEACLEMLRELITAEVALGEVSHDAA